MRIEQHRCRQSIIVAAVLLCPCAMVNAQATDDELLAFANGRATQLQITQFPVWMDYYLATDCGPGISPEDRNSPHSEKAIRVYSDKRGFAPMWDPFEKFPEGTVLLKEKFDPHQKDRIELFTGMLKHEPGFAPEIGDWEFFTLDGDATEITSRGMLDSCIACHRNYADSDFVTKNYAARASSSFQKDTPNSAVWVDARWDSDKTRVCNGSGDTVYMPASLAMTRGKDLTREEAKTKWLDANRNKDGKVTDVAPEDLSSLGGPTLRYEPVSHKNTLGYWTNVDDSASWQVYFDKPGRFKVIVLQGCGTGSGNSVVSVSLAGQTLEFEVQDTGGFQEFVWREIGEIEIKEAGQLELVVQPKTKPGVAVMDLRQIRLDRIR